jgi:phosphoribosylanthranilate isomerase
MTYVKICGLTNLEDALAALDAGADYLGFIFYDKSPRHVTIEQVEAITAHLPPGTRTVGVFVDAPLEFIYEARTRCNFKFAQLHGKESPMTVKAVVPAYKAVRPTGLSEWERLAALYLPIRQTENGKIAESHVPDLLIDAYHPTMPGGTGQTVNLEVALAARAQSDRLMLAGGLTPENVSEIASVVRPFAVDVSSGVESLPGKKDHGKLRSFVQSAREINKNGT